MAGENVDSENILVAPVMMTEESEGGTNVGNFWGSIITSAHYNRVITQPGPV